MIFDETYLPTWYALGVAFAIVLLVTPLVRRYALLVNAVDVPDERRVHITPTPRLGGVGMLIAVLAATVWFVDWGPFLPGQQLLLLDVQQLAVTLVCAFAIMLLGIIDDIRGLSWKPKLLGQIVVATTAVIGPLPFRADGTKVGDLLLVVNFIDLPFLKPIEVPVVIGVGLVVLWIVAVMNMLNFIDGVDGLAAGQAAIVAGTFAVIAASYGRLPISVLAAATAGAALGFLPYNWRKGGAKIFMGDTGSMLLGFLLATISVQGVLKTTAAISLVIPLALLAVPIADTLFVIMKRMKYRLPVSNADKWHLHHRLLNTGLSPRSVSALLWAWTASMSMVALGMRFIDYGNSKSWNYSGLALLGLLGAIAVGVSIALALRLEILKSRTVRARNRINRELAERAKAESDRVR